MVSARDFKFEISVLRSVNTPIRSITPSIERTSPTERRAMYRNVRSSGVVPRSNPSAILFDMESAARSIGSRKLRWRRSGAFSPKARVRKARSEADCQTGRSSKREYFILHHSGLLSLARNIHGVYDAHNRGFGGRFGGEKWE